MLMIPNNMMHILQKLAILHASDMHVLVQNRLQSKV